MEQSGDSKAPSIRYACEFDSSGYAVAAARCIDALVGAGVDLAWEPLMNRPEGRVRTSVAGDAPIELRSRRRPAQPLETLVLHSVPRAWSQVRSELTPAHMIGHSVWEGERLPTLWLREMDCVDELWVPTEWNRSVFADALNRPVHVVPHVADLGPAGSLPIDLPNDAFVVVAIAAWDWRKRPDRTVQAFLEAFDDRDDAILVVKTTPRPIAWFPPLESPIISIERIVASYPRPARVIVETGEWSAPELRALHERADAFLSLTAGEGWGLGAFDAACRSTPVVITGWGGQVEWLGADYPGLLPYSLVPADHPDRTLFEPDMKWAWPDLDSAVDLLRALHRREDNGFGRHVAATATQLRHRYAPPVVGSATADLLPFANIPTAAKRPTQSADDSHVPPSPPRSVLVLTPVKDAARHAAGYTERILSLEYPRDQLSVGVLVSDSTDGTEEAFARELLRLEQVGITTTLVRRDFGFRIPEGLPRWDQSVQLARRTILARSRNHLLFAALRDHDWVLWLDVDVVEFPADILTTLFAVGADIVQPDCTRQPGGPSFDRNAWTDLGQWHLDDYRGQGPIELHAVGGTMLLIRADRHRDGLVWPSWRHGIVNERARTDPNSLGRSEPGEVESEGLGMLAHDMGIGCIGLPDVEIIHE